MNLFLLEEAVDEIEWPAQDERTVHLKKVLKAKDGEKLDFGVINGPRGKGLIEWMNCGAVKISFEWNAPHCIRPSSHLAYWLVFQDLRPVVR